MGVLTEHSVAKCWRHWLSGSGDSFIMIRRLLVGVRRAAPDKPSTVLVTFFSSYLRPGDATGAGNEFT